MPLNPGAYATPWYADPDVSDAEHFIIAAWHLLATGADDLAAQLIERAVGLFDGIPPDETGRAHLGKAGYLPAGILYAETNCYDHGYYEVPAPSREAAQIPQKTADAQEAKRRRKLVKDACTVADVGYLAQRQILAAVDGKPIRQTGFAPAKTIKAVVALCAGFSPDMDPAAAAVLADKLIDVMGTSSIRHVKASAVWMDMQHVGSDICHPGKSQHVVIWRDDSSRPRYGDGLGLTWLEQDALDIVVKHAAKGRIYRDTIRALPVKTVLWKAPSFYENNCIHEVQDAISEKLKRRNVAQDDAFHAENLAYSATIAAFDLANTLRTHQAVLHSGDEYFIDEMKKINVVDPGLDVPNDLCRVAAQLWTYRTLNRPGGPTGLDTRILQDVRETVAERLARPDTVNGMSWAVLEAGTA